LDEKKRRIQGTIIAIVMTERTLAEANGSGLALWPDPMERTG